MLPDVETYQTWDKWALHCQYISFTSIMTLIDNDHSKNRELFSNKVKNKNPHIVFRQSLRPEDPAGVLIESSCSPVGVHKCE